MVYGSNPRVATTTQKSMGGKKANQMNAMKKILHTKGKPKAKSGEGKMVPKLGYEKGKMESGHKLFSKK